MHMAAEQQINGLSIGIRAIRPTFGSFSGRTCVKTAIALLALSMVFGCSRHYTPTAEEAAAKKQMVDEMTAIVHSLPHPSDAVVVRLMPMKIDDFDYFGNYKARNALLNAHYFTDESPEVACARYLGFVNSKSSWRGSWTQLRDVVPCELRDMTDNSAAGFRIISDTSRAQNERFELGISVHGMNRGKRLDYLQDGKRWKSMITVAIRRALDVATEARCLPSERTGEESCPEANWRQSGKLGP